MKWQNVSEVGMPKKSGRYLIRSKRDGLSTTSHIKNHEGTYTHWCEIDPACCKCGKVDGKDYCYEGDCLPF